LALEAAVIGPSVIKTVAALREEVRGWRKLGERVALAPTMGGLHEGHLALVRRGRELAPRVVVSIFVNPIQFNRSDDFQRYPRDLKGDLEKLAPFSVEAVYAPEAQEMYPAGFASSVAVRDLAAGLCGPHRPGHFEGVATVVAKLLLQAEPDFALFGEKDWQQLQIISCRPQSARSPRRCLARFSRWRTSSLPAARPRRPSAAASNR
jgi:pantoate--beta-alanine ligase